MIPAPRAAGIKHSYAWGSPGLAHDNGRVLVGTQDARLEPANHSAYEPYKS